MRAPESDNAISYSGEITGSTGIMPIIIWCHMQDGDACSKDQLPLWSEKAITRTQIVISTQRRLAECRTDIESFFQLSHRVLQDKAVSKDERKSTCATTSGSACRSQGWGCSYGKTSEQNGW
jgi:hypothetical protein